LALFIFFFLKFQATKLGINLLIDLRARTCDVFDDFSLEDGEDCVSLECRDDRRAIDFGKLLLFPKRTEDLHELDDIKLRVGLIDKAFKFCLCVQVNVFTNVLMGFIFNHPYS
jgi:hypothetical protein